MKKWNMVIDVAECTNCNLCTLATMDEYVGNEWPGYTKPMPRHGHKWINILQKERGQMPMIDIAYVPTMCNHCDDAPCIAKAPDAIKKRPDGIVLIDPEKAKGRKDLVDACPYGHIWWNEELEVAQAWPFDAHLIDDGISAEANGLADCVEGASVRLLKDGRLIAEASSDGYGDFKFDKLDEDSGTYVVEISANGRTRTVDARLGASVNLGEIRL